MADEDSLVSRRPKRSTAGNRMEVALAELALEEPQEPEEDIDFVVEKEEEDVFESDFASTDEEVAQEDVDQGDRTAREEERRERKTARTRVEKATAAAHARHRVTFNPEASSSQLKSKPHSKPKRRVSLGAVINAETGEIIEGGAGAVGVKRHSQRRHTVMNTSATVNRMKDAEEKRAAIPKKTKTITRLPTQDELIARALDTEEGNIIEHRNYLQLEEEKRAKARVVKKSIEGPVLRWISRKEKVKVEVQLPLPPPAPPTTPATNLYGAKYSFMYTPGAGAGMVGSQAYSMPFYAYTPLVAQNTTSKPQEAATSTSIPATSAASSIASTSVAANGTPTLSSTPSYANFQDVTTTTAVTVNSVPPAAPQPQPQTQSTQPLSATQPLPRTQSQAQPVFFPYSTAPAAPLVVHRTEEVCKNYVVHEISQSVPYKPAWSDTMSAMFGEHVRWDEVKVFTAKGRPLARPVRTCPITGQSAKYCDPRTNVPFANVDAYEVLTRVLGREYVWCSTLGCYVGVGKQSLRAKGSVEGAGGASSGSKVGEGSRANGDGDGEAQAVVPGNAEERVVKRRRVGGADG